MYGQRRVNDAVHWYMSELSTRVVAESGRPSDCHHLGKLILQGLKDAPPDFVLQIDAATGESETSRSVLERSVRCAGALSAMGLARGDVIVLMAPNHLDICIPYYAALYLGVALAPIDRTLGIMELEHMFIKDDPKIVFCQSNKTKDVRTALRNCSLDAKVITFDKSEEMNFKEMMETYGNDVSVDDFKASDFDPAETTAVLISTSGTTGLPKQASASQKNFAISGSYLWVSESKFPQPTRLALLVSPLQWATAQMKFHLSALLRYTRVQSSKDIDQEHFYDIINTYKPSYIILSPTMLAQMLKSSKGKCDWTCFDMIVTGGGLVSKKLLEEVEEVAPNTFTVNAYGMSEVTGLAFIWEETQVLRSSGKPIGSLNYRLVDPDTEQDILEPNTKGELWMKGPSIVKGYYKDPEATREAFTDDGWFKSGDLFYRDTNYNFFFADRMKMLLKYRNHQVSPVEIQGVILGHPGVQDVAVLGVPDYECGDLPVACVVRKVSSQVTAQEIKDLVKDNLTDTKQLRGGVIFMEKLPLTPGGKADVKKLKSIVIETDRE